jgi:hypothetical protein
VPGAKNVRRFLENQAQAPIALRFADGPLAASAS